MWELLQGAGLFIYPLGLCSVVGIFIIFERLFALRQSRILPDTLVDAIVDGQPADLTRPSVLGRILAFAEEHRHDDEAIHAFTRLEVNRMERGMVFLEIIIGAAPLLGLLGTVTGLVRVFGNISPETGMPNQAAFTQGIALALTTTVLGLSIAIPCLVGNSYLQRKIETYTVQIGALLERVGARQAGESVSRPQSQAENHG